jgi:hypothetical protein
MLDPSANVGETSKMRHEDPIMVCAVVTDHTCAGIFSTDINTLKNMGLKRAIDCHH